MDNWDRGLQMGLHGLSLTVCTSLGTEGWDGQLGQRPTDGTPWIVPHCPYISWGLRDGTDNWDRGLQLGLHGLSLTVHVSLGG